LDVARKRDKQVLDIKNINVKRWTVGSSFSAQFIACREEDDRVGYARESQQSWKVKALQPVSLVSGLLTLVSYNSLVLQSGMYMAALKEVAFCLARSLGPVWRGRKESCTRLWQDEG
jgi:hypothetical protein